MKISSFFLPTLSSYLSNLFHFHSTAIPLPPPESPKPTRRVGLGNDFINDLFSNFPYEEFKHRISFRIPRIILADGEKGEYIFYKDKKAIPLKERDIQETDIVICLLPPLSQSLFISLLLSTVKIKEAYFIPPLVTGTGSFTSALLTHIVLGAPFFHDGIIGHLDLGIIRKRTDEANRLRFILEFIREYEYLLHREKMQIWGEIEELLLQDRLNENFPEGYTEVFKTPQNTIRWKDYWDFIRNKDLALAIAEDIRKKRRNLNSLSLSPSHFLLN